MKTEPQVPRWDAARKKQWGFAAGMLFFLMASALFFCFARYRLNESVADGFSESRALSAAQQREADLVASQAFYRRAQTLSEAAARRGVLPANWAERRFNVRQTAMSRYEANELFFSIARANNRFFNVEEFEVAVSRDSDDGLFSAQARGQSSLLVTVQGTLIFQARGNIR